MMHLAYLAPTALTLVSSVAGTPIARRDDSAMITEFAELTPSKSLDWKPCFDEFLCTLLEVPLDYEDLDVGVTSIAFIKHPSNETDAQDLLYNPGGPGGSGVNSFLQEVSQLRLMIGDDYNFVTFDPRGVNNSGPSVDCFPDPELVVLKGQLYEDVFRPVDGSDEDILETTFNRVASFGEWCTAVHSVNDTAKYANTVAVANDMRHYVELNAEASGQKKEDAKLYYYGVSYGTLLGATYATLFPNRIGRMVLDAVVDTEDYYTNGWQTALADADAVMDAFYKFCVEAGPEECVYAGNSTTSEELGARTMAIYATLKEEGPIEFFDLENGISPITLTWENLASAITSAAYNVAANGPGLAEALALLEVGNYTDLAVAKLQQTAALPGYDPRDARTHVSCTDANGRFNTSTLEEFKEYVDHQNQKSFYLGPSFSTLTGSTCRKLEVFPPESQVFPGRPGADSTSSPILFIGNTYDPVTPLRSAKKVASTFPGAVVLQVDAAGHGAVGQVSKCASSAVQQYLLDGSLPEPDTICDVDIKPFQPRDQ